MQLKNQVEWALHCCSILASAPEGGRLSTKDLAELHGVPKEYLSKALQALSAAGIVEGTLGPTGGYRLARPVAKISFSISSRRWKAGRRGSSAPRSARIIPVVRLACATTSLAPSRG